MNVLLVGGSKAGSWSMRGLQLGAAIGARVTSSPSAADFGWSDVVVLVKRAGEAFASQAHAAQRPIVWDALDFWRQPADHGLTASQATTLLHARIRALKPALTIGATEAMAQACDGVYLSHHAHVGLIPTPARAVVSTVGYEGNPVYLGKWGSAIHAACRARGWAFVINPPDLGAMDLLVAFREDPWDGWICREWKSGVKVVNAIAAGRPIVTQASAAVRELSPSSSVLATTDAVAGAFDDWSALGVRERTVQDCAERAPEGTLSAIADRYRQILQSVRTPCSV